METIEGQFIDLFYTLTLKHLNPLVTITLDRL